MSEKPSVIGDLNAYLQGGGLFNPELADHDAVSQMVVAARDELATLRAQLEQTREQNRQMIAGKVHDDQQHARVMAEISERQAAELRDLREQLSAAIARAEQERQRASLAVANLAHADEKIAELQAYIRDHMPKADDQAKT